MTPQIQSKQVQSPRDADSRERSWLVFRLGPHVMCASVLDVEGIIERPRVITTLPVMPEYALGAFLFRDHSATAISLRKKLKVREGEDSVKGPFIAARIRDAIVAFWVDEVKDVIEQKDTAWRPMPEMLAGGLFDRFTIREGELILHTSFATLLEAEVEIQSVAHWAASQIDSGVTHVAPAAAPETAQPLGSEDAAAGSEAHMRTQSTEAAAAGAPEETPPIVETSSARSAKPGADAQGKGADRAGDSGHAATAAALSPGIETDPSAAPAGVGATARASAADIPGGGDVHEVPRSAPARDAIASEASGAERHRQESRDSETRPPYPRTPYSNPVGIVSVSPQAGAGLGTTGTTALEHLSTVTSRNIFDADRSPRSSTRYWIGGAVLAIAVLAGMLYAFSPGYLGDTRPPAASMPPATSSTRDIAPQTPVPATAADAARDAAAAAVASPKPDPAPQQIVSIKSEGLTLTVERPPAKDARPAAARPAAPATGAAGRPADQNTRTHFVVRGDTLWDIAKKYVGDPYRYPELAEFSNIRNPDLIYPGDIVRIEIRENRR